MVKQDMIFDPKFANWNKFYDDLFLEISAIRTLGHKSLMDIKNSNGFLLNYYSRITNLFSSHYHFINDNIKIQKELENIEDILFSSKYAQAVKNNSNSITQHVKITRGLRNIFSLMCKSFSDNGISVKVSGKVKYNPGQAIQNGGE